MLPNMSTWVLLILTPHLLLLSLLVTKKTESGNAQSRPLFRAETIIYPGLDRKVAGTYYLGRSNGYKRRSTSLGLSHQLPTHSMFYLV